MMEKSIEKWVRLLEDAKRLVLIAHISPDGDTIGAVLALRLAFLEKNISVDVVCDGSVPKNIDFLPGCESILQPGAVKGMHYDTAIAVDVSDKMRMGTAINVFDAADIKLVLDHHATNVGFGDVNWICGEESSTCVLAYKLIQKLNIPIDKKMATCLMTGISTDTGHFQYASTTCETFEAAADLIRNGVDLSDLTRRIYRTQAIERVKLMRRAYINMRFELDGRVGVISLSKKDFEESGASYESADGIVNRALEVEGVQMAIMATERENGIKVSMRSFEPYDVAQIAAQFGGGGHIQAAGCTIEGSLEDAINKVLMIMEDQLEK